MDQYRWGEDNLFNYVALGILGLSILGGISGSAPQAIDLVSGQVYRTGSPLSQPGIVGLVGGWAGTHTGGGYEVWQGPHVAAGADVFDLPGRWVPVNGQLAQPQSATLTVEQAQAAQDAVDWQQVPNQLRTVVPDCAGILIVTYVPDSVIGARAIYICQ